MISVLALLGGITGMFVLFGVAWKLVAPTLAIEALVDEIGPPPKAWENEPTPNAESSSPPSLAVRNTITYGVPPLPAPPKPGSLGSARPPVRRPTIAPPVEDDDVKTHFFDRAALSLEGPRHGIDATLETTEVLGEEPIP